MAGEATGLAEIEEYTKKLLQSPESLVFVPLAETYRKNGLWDEAIEVCQQGLQFHPTYLSARVCLGRSYMEKKLYAEAQQEFKKVIELEPNNIMARGFLANIYMLQNQYTEAMQECEIVLAINPDHVAIQFLLDEAKSKLGVVPEVKPEKLTSVQSFTPQVEDSVVVPAFTEGLSSSLQAAPVVQPAPASATINFEPDQITGDDLLSVMKDIGGLIFDRGEESQTKVADYSVVEPKNDAPFLVKEKAVKAEPTKKESVKEEVVLGRSKITDKESDLEAVLNELNKKSGILGSMLLTTQGDLVASVLKNGMDLNGAVSAGMALFIKTAEASQRMQWGNVAIMIISCETTQIIIVETKKGILNVLADSNASLGLIKLALNETVKKING